MKNRRIQRKEEPFGAEEFKEMVFFRSKKSRLVPFKEMVPFKEKKIKEKKQKNSGSSGLKKRTTQLYNNKQR